MYIVREYYEKHMYGSTLSKKHRYASTPYKKHMYSTLYEKHMYGSSMKSTCMGVPYKKSTGMVVLRIKSTCTLLNTKSTDKGVLYMKSTCTGVL